MEKPRFLCIGPFQLLKIHFRWNFFRIIYTHFSVGRYRIFRFLTGNCDNLINSLPIQKDFKFLLSDQIGVLTIPPYAAFCRGEVKRPGRGGWCRSDTYNMIPASVIITIDCETSFESSEKFTACAIFFYLIRYHTLFLDTFETDTILNFKSGKYAFFLHENNHYKIRSE